MSQLSPEDRIAHWHRTRNLMIGHLIVWFFFAFVVHAFAAPLNNIYLFHFPLGYYMAAQGSLAAFVIQLFIFMKQQDKIDRQYGVAED